MSPSALSAEQRQALLAYLADRLGTGEVLVTAEQFQAAAEEGYRVLTGDDPDAATKAALAATLKAAHREDPGALLVPGIENWISLSLLARVRKEGLDITEVSERGTHLVRAFLREDRARALIEQLGLTPQQINMGACQRFVLNRVAGRQDEAHKQAAGRLARVATAAAQRPASPAEARAAAEARVEALLQGPLDLPDEAEAAARSDAEKATTRQLRAQQMNELVAHLDNYVELGRISAEDAERLRKVHQIDQAVRGGRMDRDQGSKVRNSVLAGTARDRIERSVKDAVDYAVAYLQVFGALKRIEPRFDPALRFLVRHGEVINADATDAGPPAGLGGVVEILAADADVLRALIDMMDRKEAEVRMIAAHLPPYSQILRRDQGRVERVAVDEPFVEALRRLPDAQLSERLHAADRRARARPAAALLSLTVLIGRLVKPTPFRRELRLLKVNLIIEEFYHATEDVSQARQRARDFLRGRLRTLYPDLSREETEALQARGEEIIDQVEARVLAERGAAEPAADGAETEAGEDDTELTEAERKLGVQIHRIAVRGAAGRMMQIPYKVGPDPDDEARTLVLQRDPESGELVPMLRRGNKRYVARGRDGTWQFVRD